MDQRIIQFINAMRSAGVRISLSESADAFRAVDQLGIQERENFKISLRTTLIKESQEFPTFEDLFPLFFDNPDSLPMLDINQDLTPEEDQLIKEILQQLKKFIQKMVDKIIQGERLSEQELDQIVGMVGLDRVDDLRYRNWLSQRMKQALHFREIQRVLEAIRDLLEEMGVDSKRAEQIFQQLRANQKSMADQIDQFVGQRIAENMSQHVPDNKGTDLFDRRFDLLTDKDLDDLKREITRLATALRTRIALRMKKSKSGYLDAKATLRANLRHGNVPIDLRHRNRTLKPKLVVVCDISTSMRPVSELMLHTLYTLQDQISKTYSFAFIDHLENISSDFQRKGSRDAVKHVLARMPPGHYNTDLGHSLLNFTQKYMDKVDYRTTFIIVGDGRNNYNDPRSDLFRQISRRAQRVFWLNPESPEYWVHGDSDMMVYAPICNLVLKVSNFSELVKAIDKMLVPN